MMTRAEMITIEMSGTDWTTKDGRELMDALRSDAVRHIQQGCVTPDRPTKWIMADGSAIVTAGAAWDYAADAEDDACYCMAGAGHDPLSHRSTEYPCQAQCLDGDVWDSLLTSDGEDEYGWATALTLCAECEERYPQTKTRIVDLVTREEYY